MRPSDSNLGARHRVNRSLIQTQRPRRLATEFESVSNSLGGARPSLNRMAASNINLDAAIRARFSGSVVELGELTKIDELGQPTELIQLGELTHADGYLMRVRVTKSNLARDGHLHPHQAPAGRYLSTFTGTCWRVPGTKCHI
ncbi:hypothetical protein PCASD_24024 [Puccinia coronata f. sp. avenae]|uniref:Uncharacterized protein n=1 Tax=Puccinia coronata f. sp. avenae TaxID=200324 RepID=A0A2N5TRQ5_9BASI|nr:hypothetical protein PCASD_24024 [Puccinia coronata f. sp. avenae]